MPHSLHPDPELLLGFIDSPADPKYRQLGLHLANCPQCRLQAGQFQALALGLPSIPLSLLRNDSILSQSEATAVANNTLTAADVSRLQQDPGKLKAALHLAAQAHVRRTEGASRNFVAMPTVARQKPSLFSPLVSALASLFAPIKARPPQWSTVALTAVLVTGLTLAVDFYAIGNNNLIVAYQDNPVVIFKQIKTPGPGLGFFSDISSETAAFPAMDIQQHGADQLYFRWHAVNDAARYQLRLYRIQNGLPELISETSTAQNWLQLESMPLQAGVRYEWQLSGETKSQKSFKTAGGFVIQGDIETK